MQGSVDIGERISPTAGRLERAGRGEVLPFEKTSVPPTLRIPRRLAAGFAGGVAAAAYAGFASRRRAPIPLRVLRAILFGSTAAYFVTTALDLAEHLRMEKQVTGSYLRAVAVPLSESAIHAAILATNFSAIALARPFRRPMGAREAWLLLAPAVFLALGWADEIGYHRRRAPHREDIIHTTEHLAEGVMWTSLYASRLPRWR